MASGEIISAVVGSIVSSFKILAIEELKLVKHPATTGHSTIQVAEESLPRLPNTESYASLVRTRNRSGRCTRNSHLSGGTPPLEKRPRGGNNSGLQPCAGKKNASGAKLKAVSPGRGGSSW